MTTKRNAELAASLAAMELENLRLRSALENTKQYVGFMAIQQIDKLLSTPHSTSTLAALVEKVERLTIERCLDASWGSVQTYEEIRALPTGNIKLEDLL